MVGTHCPARLLRELHRGRRSRNRDFELFEAPGGWRVFRGYRRVLSLLAEISRPGVRAGARWVDDRGILQVAVEIAELRYRRVVILEEWEARFLVETGGEDLAGAIPPRPALP